MKSVTSKKSKMSFKTIGLGTNAIGGHNIYPNINENVSRDIVRRFIQEGGDFIDTAYFYGLGRSEELIGQVIKEMGVRQKVVIATKGSFVVNEKGITHDNSISFLLQAVEDSLKRLQTNYLDIFYIHFPDEKTKKDDAVAALQQLKENGIIRAIGVSNFSLDQLKEANKDGFIDIVQDRYHLLNRDIEGEYTDYLKENDIMFIPYSPLASGLLTGKYSLDSTLSERQLRNPLFMPDNYEDNLEKIDVLKRIASNKDVAVNQVVLAWLLTRDFVSAVIPGAKKVEQVLSNLATASLVLSKEEIDLIDRTFKT
jgi:myo-inositol catabolism protein IolS